jgi:signal transduction histidine kinase
MSEATILYIEDDPASRIMVGRVLRDAGYRVLLADRGLVGIDLARANQPDLILMDLDLPDMGGRELTTTLRRDERFQETPIVALTGHTVQDKQETAFAAGLTGYLTKPFDLVDLLGEVRFYLTGGQDAIDDQRLSAAQVRYTQEVVASLEQRVRDLERVNQELQNLERMKANFIQITAHELRTPLTLIYGYNRLLLDHPTIEELVSLDTDVAHLLEGLSGSVRRMHAMVEEILITSRVIVGHIDLSHTFINLGLLMQQVVDHYMGALQERKLKLHFNRQEWPTRMLADAEKTRLLLDHLLSNAIKYTPDGGTIRLQAAVNGANVDVVVSDTGIGIATQDQNRIFNQFSGLEDFGLHSTSKTAFRGGGLGLGLFVCRGIVEAHNGTIHVESDGYDPERCPGSRFVVRLPLRLEATDDRTT